MSRTIILLTASMLTFLPVYGLAQEAQRLGSNMTCEEASRTRCVPTHASATASVMCTAVRDGCDKVAESHRNVSDRSMFRSFCQAQLTDLDRSGFRTTQILSRYRYNTAPPDAAAEIGKEIGGLYGAAVQLLAGAMGAGIRAGLEVVFRPVVIIIKK